MNKYIIPLLVLFSSFLKAQEKNAMPRDLLQFTFGGSFNGTGDIYGLQYGVAYLQNLQKGNFYWGVGFEGTSHSDEELDYFFEDELGNNLDGKSRYVVSGVQLTATIGYSVRCNRQNLLRFGVGPLVRYQASSIPDQETILFPAITDFPVPVKISTFTGPMETIAVGAQVKIQYNYVLRKNFLLGVVGGLQIDTNADTISHLSLAMGKKF